MATISDIEKMIVRIGTGDRKSFSALYDATSAKLFGICLRILNNRAEAEDALQETFVRVWQGADSFAANGYSPMTWLITLTRNLAIDKLRARKAPTEDIDEVLDLGDGGPTSEKTTVAASEPARIKACLDEVMTDHALALRAAYLEGERYQELADHLGVPVNSMRTGLRRSLLNLNECLGR